MSGITGPGGVRWTGATPSGGFPIAGGAGAPAPDVEDPKILPHDEKGVADGKVAMARPKGQLFVNGAGADDPQQGWLGDCYFIASLSAIAQVAPGVIENAIKDNGDGTYDVTLYDFDDKGNAKPALVKVDLDLLVKAGDEKLTPYYGASTGRTADGGQELWVSVLEKAFAKHKGSYEEIGMKGGNPAEAMQMLTGKKATIDLCGARLDRTELPPPGKDGKPVEAPPLLKLMEMMRQGGGDRVWASLAEGTAKKQPMAAVTYTDPGVLQRGLMPVHAYTVVGVEEKDGKKLVTLRNPAPYIPEITGNEALKAGMEQNEDLKHLAEMLTSNQLGLASLKYGTFQISFEEFRNSFMVASRGSV